MTLKLSERELEELLRQPGTKPKPPADLLARLRADLPAELDLLPPPAEPAPANVLRPARWTRPLISLAATLAVVAGGSLIAYRSFRDTALPAPADESAVASSPAPVAQRTPPPAELNAETRAETRAEARAAPRADDRPAPPAGAPSAGSRADQAGGRSRNLQPGAFGPEPPKKHDLPPPVAEQLQVAPPPPPPPPGIAAGVAGGVLLDAKEREDAAPAPAGDDEENALREETAPAAPPLAREAPALENPGIEANRQAPAEPQAFGELEKRKETRRLESPTTQGDALRPELSRAAAAAAPKQVDALAAEADLGEAWRRIERELAAGGWPVKEAIAAARASAKDEKALAGRSAPRAAEKAAADPTALLREDLLGYLDRREHGRLFLLDLRRRAVRLAEKRPEDERISSVLRIINLAIKLSPD